jgi:hypothetical protein
MVVVDNRFAWWIIHSNKVSEKGSENKTHPEKHFFVNLTL